jgi:hypothetical protein
MDVQDLLQFALALLAVGATAVSIMAQGPLVAYLKARAAEINNSLAKAAVLSLIEYLETRAKSASGPERMQRLLAIMAARGMPVDEDLAEALFQQWQRKRKAEAAAAAPTVQVPSVWTADQDAGYTVTGASSPATEVAPNA